MYNFEHALLINQQNKYVNYKEFESNTIREFILNLGLDLESLD